MKTQGKLSVEGCNNAWEETRVLKNIANKSAKIQKQIEKTNEILIVPIKKGVVFVTKNKYEKNKKHYNEMAIGKIRMKK